jgi:Tol biopolymer transport system component
MNSVAVYQRPPPPMKAVLLLTRSIQFLCLLPFIPSLANPAQGAVGGVSLADPSLAGAPWGNGDSLAADMSSDGRYTVMLSSASNLTRDPSVAGVVNVYVRDRVDGSVVLVSRSRETGGAGNGHSTGARITPDGGQVVFQSWASDLVGNDENESEDIFLWDAASGTTRLVSVKWDGSRSGNGGSSAPVLTPDGRYIAFVSAASDLVAGDNNGIPDIFVRDMQDGGALREAV